MRMRQNERLDGRGVLAGMVCGAVALLVGGALPAAATIIHVELGTVIEVANGGGTTETNLDIDGAGLSDIDFFSGQNGSSARGGFGGGSSGSAIFGIVVDDGGPDFQAINNLSAGTVISDALVIGDGTQIGDEIFLNDPSGGILYNKNYLGPQEFIDGTEGYLATKFNIPGAGTTHFGWVRVLVEVSGVRIGIPPADDPGARLTIIDAAYESVPGASIIAGAIPEPSSLALFACGAALFAMMRRRSR